MSMDTATRGYPGANSSLNQTHQFLNIGGVRIRCDAMAKVKDVRTIPQRLNQALSITHKRIAARYH